MLANPFIAYTIVYNYNRAMLNDYVNTKQAAERTGISVTQIRRLLEDGNVEGFKVQRDWLVDIRSLDHYSANRPKPGRKPGSGRR